MSNLDLNVRVVDKTQAALGRIDQRIKGLDKSVAGINTRGKLLIATLAGIATGTVVRGIVSTTARFEDLRTSLASVTGSAQAGAEAFDFISRFATKTQFGVEDLSQTFIKLKAAGIEPTEKLLTTFTDTAAVTTDQLGSLTAITDLLARTTSGGLGLEELNRLADRGIPVFRILEEQLGITRLEISEFGKTAEGARKITEALLGGLDKSFGGATAARAQNLSTRISNLQIAIANAADSLGQGLNEALGDTIVDITELIEKNDDLIKQFGVSLGEAIGKSSEFIKGLRDEFDLVKDAFDDIITGYNTLPPYVKEAGLIGALLLGKRGLIALAVISGIIGTIKKQLDDIGQTEFDIDPNLTGQKRVEAIDEMLLKVKNRMQEIEDADFGKSFDFSVITPGGTMTAEDLGLDFTDEYNNLSRQLITLEAQKQTALQGSAFAHGELNDAVNNSKKSTMELGELREVEIEDLKISTKLYDDAIKAYGEMAEASERMVLVPVGTAAEENRKQYQLFVDQIKKTERAMLLLDPRIASEKELFDQLSATIPGLTDSLAILDEQLADIFEQESPFFEFGQHIKEQADVMKQLGRVSTQVYDQMADRLTDFVMTGKFNFADFSRFVIRELIKIAVQAAITFAIKTAAGAFGIPIPGLAEGGPVRRGNPYVVGEQGPELFIPQSSGRIVPNDEMTSDMVSADGGGQQVNINFNITATDASSFDELLITRRSTIVGIINEGLNRQGKRSLV